MATTGIYALSTSDVNKLSDLPATFNSRIYMEALKAVSDETVYKIYNPHGKLSYVGFQYGTNAPIEWHQFITNTDLHKVTYKKNFGGFSANSMREFLIAVINKVLENNLWTSSEDVIVFCATWFGHSYGMGILASQNSNNDIIISYDSEDGNSYTMHYVPSTNTVKTFYKRQGTSLL